MLAALCWINWALVTTGGDTEPQTAVKRCSSVWCSVTFSLKVLFTNTLFRYMWITAVFFLMLHFFQHSGSELVYTNTLKSVRPYTKVSRQPSLILPLACRIPGVQATGPNYKISLPSETEMFGPLRIWIEVLMPGEGPMAEFTRTPKFRSLQLSPERSRREAESPSKSDTSTNSSSANSTDNSSSTSGAVGSRITQLDLHVMSNCSIKRAEMIVSNCIESETEDFAESRPILRQGLVTINLFPAVGGGQQLEENRSKSQRKSHKSNSSLFLAGAQLLIH